MHSRYLYSNTPNVRRLPNALLVSIECRGEGIEVVGEFHQSKTPHMAKIQSSKDFFSQAKQQKRRSCFFGQFSSSFEVRMDLSLLSQQQTKNEQKR